MLFFIIMLSTIIIVNIAFYYSTKKTASYQDGRLLLVNIPAYACNLSEVKEIEDNFTNQLEEVENLSYYESKWKESFNKQNFEEMKHIV